MESHCERWMMSWIVVIEMAEAVYKIIQTKEQSTL
jgi:hypothetical protein